MFSRGQPSSGWFRLSKLGPFPPPRRTAQALTREPWSKKGVPAGSAALLRPLKRTLLIRKGEQSMGVGLRQGFDACQLAVNLPSAHRDLVDRIRRLREFPLHLVEHVAILAELGLNRRQRAPDLARPLLDG